MRNVKFKLGQAFTLIEIMIAMTIFTVIIVAVYSSWAAIVKGSRVGLKAAAEAQRSRIAMHTIEDALLTTQLYTENINYYNFIADTSDPKFAWLSLAARLPATFPGSGLFGDQVVRRVTFSVEPGPDGTNNLVMTQLALLQVTNSEVSAYPIVLAKDVSLFVLEFWDPQTSDWTDELLTTNQIPQMVRVSLGIGQSRNSQPAEVTSRIIVMPSIAVGADVQNPGRGGAAGGGGGGGINGRGGSGGVRGNGKDGTRSNGSGNGQVTPGGPGGFNNGGTRINPGNPRGGFPR
jgi:prepilin-type N-terminal cleavage/methylation domain-containing protein